MRMIQAAVAEQDGNIVYYLQRLVELIGTFFPQIIDAMDREFVFDDGVIAARGTPAELMASPNKEVQAMIHAQIPR